MARLTAREIALQPGFLLGCLGLALCLVVRDLQQFITFDVVSVEAASKYSFSAGRVASSAALLAVCMVALRGRSAQKLFDAALPVGAVGAVLETAGLAVLAMGGSLQLHALGAVVLGLGQSALVTACILYVLRLRQRAAYMAIAAAFIAAGAIEMLLALMNPAVTAGLMFALPALSCILTTAGFRRLDASAFLPEPEPDGSDDLGQTLALGGRTVLVLATFFGYSIIARRLTDVWMGGITQESLEVFQLFAGLGTLLAGIVVYVIFTLRRSLKNASVHTVFALFAMAIALYLSTFLTGYLSAIFLVPLFILRKMLLFLPVMAARGYGFGRRAACVFLLGLLVVDLGNIAHVALFDAIEASGLPTDVVSSAVILAIAVFIVAVDASSAVRALNEQGPAGKVYASSGPGIPARGTADDSAGSGAPTDGTIPHSEADSVAETGEGETDGAPLTRDDALAAMASAAGLSPREAEVLGYLAAGRNAEHIARALCIAPSTAKSHIAHIYRKTGFNSQQRLMDAVDEWDTGESKQAS